MLRIIFSHLRQLPKIGAAPKLAKVSLVSGHGSRIATATPHVWFFFCKNVDIFYLFGI